jgi:hypothetical protein
MGAELPRLGRLFHLFLVHRFVYHARYLHIASQRKPPQTILRITLLGLELQQRLPRVEEETKFLNPYLKQLGKKEMTALVEKNQEGDSEHEL